MKIKNSEVVRMVGGVILQFSIFVMITPITEAAPIELALNEIQQAIAEVVAR